MTTEPFTPADLPRTLGALRAEGSELREHPYRPLTPASRRTAAERGDDLPVGWLHRSDRYGEKLATPDTSVGDLIGDVDPIKVAEGRTLGDPETIHFGLVPRTNRGIFAVNELPDLAERIQVALLNVLEERDIQVRGYQLRLPLDLLLVASANPEDYTNRGRIITPLKDRFGAEVHTHYPVEIELEADLVTQEAHLVAEVPGHLIEVLARYTRAVRDCPAVDQRSGVSARFAIAAAETVAASALRRSGLRGERDAVARVCDTVSVTSTLRGKVEFDAGEEGREVEILAHLLRTATADTFRARLGGVDLSGFTDLVAEGAVIETGDLVSADQLGQEHPGATLDDVDADAVERQLGRGAADDLRRLRELERELRRQGWLTRGADGLKLSPKALRRLGGTALKQIFASFGGRRQGSHDLLDAGAGGEPTGASRRWHFGDSQPLDVVRTVTNAVTRGNPVRLRAGDFEVAETERRVTAAVALCVDLSFSMVSDGRWGPMKQTALALSHLVRTRFPQDALQIIGFGRYAMPLTEAELAAVEADMIQGTNLQHALKLAGRHVRRHPGAEPVVLVVTDGEPTAHLDDGEAVFRWPSTPYTIRVTLAEVDQLTRYGATLNLFMLGEDPGLRRFVDAVARRSGGRVFSPEAADLGRYLVDDYVRARRGRR